MSKRLIQGPAEPVWIVDSSGNPIDWTDITDEPLVFGAIQTATMGNAVPAEVVAVNLNRRGLIIRNCSDTVGYFSFGDGAGMTTTLSSWEIRPGYAVYFDPPHSQQAISAICGAAAKTVAYQEAT